VADPDNSFMKRLGDHVVEM